MAAATKKVLCIFTGYLPEDEGGTVLERYEDWFGDDRDAYEIPATRLGEYLRTGHFVLLNDDDEE